MTGHNESPETVQVSGMVAFALRTEAQRLGISEEEMVARAWSEFVRTNRRQIRHGFLRRPWALLQPGGFRLLAKAL